ncbi:MAG: hypothetical protein JWN25_3411 [Verrucomicrobiales bacterium]|nr:hypothetical protein [Verrucomicrobiales bacterium]
MPHTMPAARGVEKMKKIVTLAAGTILVFWMGMHYGQDHPRSTNHTGGGTTATIPEGTRRAGVSLAEIPEVRNTLENVLRQIKEIYRLPRRNGRPHLLI